MALDPYERISWRGVTANRRTIEMLEVTELRALMKLAPLRIPQGSYSTGVSASGGTHSGGGALDISVRDMSSAQKDWVVRQLRETSFAAWHRLPSQGPWVEHIHAIAIGDKEMSGQAAWQVSEYRAGHNGLKNQGADDGPKVPITVYRQAIDMSYYGPEKWNQADFDRLFAKFHAAEGWGFEIANQNTDPVSKITAAASLSNTHEHATDAETFAKAAAASAKTAADTSAKILEKLNSPPV